jgi:type IV pilus assembly protein PilE
MTAGCGRQTIRPLRTAGGFSLIEVMIVIVLMAVLAAVAIPNYQGYVLRSKRAAAKQVLMEAAQYLERNYTTAGCYDYGDTKSCLAGSGTGIVKPSTLLLAPSEGRASYLVTWALASSTYTLSAIPCGDAGTCVAGSEATFKDSICGTLTLTNTGSRGATTGSVSTCWQH